MPREVRIVGGRLRRSRIPVASRPGLRPTPDRVRETLFNWLGQDLTGWSVLDAFAGTGALGFEACSRGADPVCMIESDGPQARQLRATAQRLQVPQVRVERCDALDWMARAAPGQFDLILLDPPFEANLFESAWRVAIPLLKPGAWLYLEAPAQWGPQASAVTPQRHLKAGAVHAHLWKFEGNPST